MKGTLIGPFGRYELGTEVVTIGRARANKIIIDASLTSGRHAEVRPEGDGYVVVDVDSTNGTKLNGLKIPAQKPQPLRNGDVINVGGADIQVEIAAGIAYAPTERIASPPGGAAYAPTERVAAPPGQGGFAPTERVAAPPPPPPGPFGTYAGASPVGPASYYPDPLVPPPPPYTPPPPGYGVGATIQAPSPFPPPPGGSPGFPVGAPIAPFVSPPVQPPPKRPPYILIGGIVAGVLIIGGFLAILLATHGTGGTSNGSSTATPKPSPTATPVPGPEEITKQFYTDIELQNYMGAYQYLAPNFKTQESEQAFSNTFSCSDRQAGTVTSFTTMLISNNNTQASVQVHVIRPGLTYDDPVQLTNAHGSWGIESFRFVAGCG